MLVITIVNIILSIVADKLKIKNSIVCFFTTIIIAGIYYIVRVMNTGYSYAVDYEPSILSIVVKIGIQLISLIVQIIIFIKLIIEIRKKRRESKCQE